MLGTSFSNSDTRRSYESTREIVSPRCNAYRGPTVLGVVRKITKGSVRSRDFPWEPAGRRRIVRFLTPDDFEGEQPQLNGVERIDFSTIPLSDPFWLWSWPPLETGAFIDDMQTTEAREASAWTVPEGALGPRDSVPFVQGELS
jgi:hypothetical protein